MGEIQIPILFNLLIFLAFPFIGGYTARKLQLPAIIGYIIGGILLGFLFEDRMSAQVLSEFANFGIILLLFTVGLEVDLLSLKRFGRFVVIGGTAQIIISGIFIFLLSFIFKFSLLESIFVGFSFALSSTAVVAKIIQEKGEENSLLGGLIIGILVLQDLVVIPMIIIFSSFGEGSGYYYVLKNLIYGLLKSGLVLTLVYLLGRNLIPTIFDKLAKLSREILNLFTVLLIIFVVYIFALFGLSASIAAFATGIIVGQTREHYHVFSQIRPLRDLFAILFFVSLGASIKLSQVLPIFPKILLFVTILVLLKFFIILTIFILYRFHSRTSFSLAIYLSQVGEFAFVIMHQGFSQEVVSSTTYLFAITSVLLTISITPLLTAHKEKIYLQIKKFIEKRIPTLGNFLKHSVDQEPAHVEVLQLKNHVIICGFGRVGSYIGKALQQAKVDFIAIDYNFYVVEKAKQQKIPIIYGDPTDIDILDYAQAEHARALVCVVPEKLSQEAIIVSAKKLNPDIQIFTRVHFEQDQKKMRYLGAKVVVQPEFEASLAIIKQVLKSLKISNKEISKEFKLLKLEHNSIS